MNRHGRIAVAGAAAIALALAAWPEEARAQDGQDEPGTWLIYNGTFRFTESWSVFTEAQLRLYNVAWNPQETFGRAAAQYHVTDFALVALGYMYAVVWPYDDETGETTHENRIYEQFTIKHNWDRTVFEHRYRIEQRWINGESSGTTYKNRARYRIQITSPFNRPTMQAGAWFLNTYVELFIGFGEVRLFDQARLYGAGGYQFNDDANLQLGYLYQGRGETGFHRLQVFLTYNFDFRDD